MLSSLMDRLDIVSGEVKQMEARVVTLKGEVSDLRSMSKQLGNWKRCWIERWRTYKQRL